MEDLMPTSRRRSPEMGGRRGGMYGLLLFSVAVLLRVHGGSARNQTCDADELAALRAFADDLDGGRTGLVGWGADSGGSCCSWTGVSCDLRGSVVALDLSRNALLGQAPAGLAALPDLRFLDLSANALSGAFPANDGSGVFFPAIQVLNVSFNNFAGPHPVFPGAANLTVLDVSGNNFSGSIDATALCSIW